jgi:hypothetical protein
MKRFSVLAAVCCLLVTAAPVAAKPKPITGTLAKKGYTVVAIGYDGKAVSTRARHFRLRVTGKVTLHLRSPRGKYAGPIVVGQRKGRAVLGVKPGAKLGKLSIEKGYARTKKPLKRRFTDRARTASLKRGAPLGNGRNFGLARSRAHGPSGAGGDTDRDGVPNLLDIDVDGDRVLNPLDRSGVKASAAQKGEPSTGFNNFSQMFLRLDETVNANASGVTDAAIDNAMREHLSIVMLQVPQDTELDCGGLSYCSAGGTGRMEADALMGQIGDPFPGAFDTDGDGMGTMRLNDRGEFRLSPFAPSSKIGSGDTMIQRTADGREIPGSLAFVFNTVPAMATWADGAGNQGTFHYPAPSNTIGTQNNPVPLARNASGDYVLTVTFWRPQRRAIATAGEDGDFIDIGGLGYEVNVPNVPRSPSAQPGSGRGPQCPPAALSTNSPELRVSSDPSGGFGKLVDSAPDRPASAANELSFTVNLSECARLRGGSLQPGDWLNTDIGAIPANAEAHDHANQVLYVKMG